MLMSEFIFLMYIDIIGEVSPFRNNNKSGRKKIGSVEIGVIQK